jgi:hypothetical protein
MIRLSFVLEIGLLSSAAALRSLNATFLVRSIVGDDIEIVSSTVLLRRPARLADSQKPIV